LTDTLYFIYIDKHIGMTNIKFIARHISVIVSRKTH